MPPWMAQPSSRRPSTMHSEMGDVKLPSWFCQVASQREDGAMNCRISALPSGSDTAVTDTRTVSLTDQLMAEGWLTKGPPRSDSHCCPSGHDGMAAVDAVLYQMSLSVPRAKTMTRLSTCTTERS